MTQSTPRASSALCIAGSDSGGGAGVQADLKTFSALGVYGASVLTAVTAQNTRAVTAVHEIPPDIIHAQLQAVFDDIAVDAVKVGMVSAPTAIEVIADALHGREVPVVVDPVMVAKSGDSLLRDDAIDLLRGRLLYDAALITPNLPEAARILGCGPAESEEQMLRQARGLLDTGARAVLLKGGHGAGAVCIDLLVEASGRQTRFEAPRIFTRNTHGTGCSLSSAITAGLSRGLPLVEAVSMAHGWLQRAIGAADRLGVGAGHGPVHHFHATWDAS